MWAGVVCVPLRVTDHLGDREWVSFSCHLWVEGRISCAVLMKEIHYHLV